MIFVDTHTHLYLEAFDTDRELVIERSVQNNVLYHLLPNIDIESISQLIGTSEKYPENCFPMMGLHPTSVRENHEKELQLILNELSAGRYIGIGEIGIDLYWDKTFEEQQIEVFTKQLKVANQMQLPVSIHSRNSLDLILKIIKDLALPNLQGILHCFPGNLIQAKKAIDMGLYLGIGGVVTYKKSGLQEVVSALGLDHLVLETDAPFLPPVPYRGQRNESSYIPVIAERIAWFTNSNIETVADKTTENVMKIYQFNTNKNGF